jgi:hypothetical protein
MSKDAPLFLLLCSCAWRAQAYPREGEESAGRRVNEPLTAKIAGDGSLPIVESHSWNVGTHRNVRERHTQTAAAPIMTGSRLNMNKGEGRRGSTARR